MLFTSPDYELVVMPMLTTESRKPTDEAETAEPERVLVSEHRACHKNQQSLLLYLGHTI